jgi:hypothetical protein
MPQKPLKVKKTATLKKMAANLHGKASRTTTKGIARSPHLLLDVRFQLDRGRREDVQAAQETVASQATHGGEGAYLYVM